MTLLWAPRADSFPGNRLNTKVSDTVIILSAKITDKQGKSCAEPINEKLPQTTTQATTEIPVSIISECIDPQLALSFSDQNGNVLDEKEFNVQSTMVPGSKDSNSETIVVIVVIFLIAILIAFYMKKKNNKMNNSDSNLEGPNREGNNVIASVLFLIALVGLASFGFNKIEKVIAAVGSTADTYAVSMSTNIDDDAYFVGDRITATGSASLGVCANAVTNFKLYVNIDGGRDYLMAERAADADPTEQTIYGSFTMRAPSTIGQHTVRFTLEVEDGTVERRKTFTVLPRPTVATYVDGEKSRIIPIGGSAIINWEATNATLGCDCTLSPAAGSGSSCGSSRANEDFSGDKNITNISQRTTVSVKCSSSDYAPPSTTTTKVIGDDIQL